jgi:hypothetical protein
MPININPHMLILSIISNKVGLEAMALKTGANGPTDPTRYDFAVHAGEEKSLVKPSYKKCQPIRTRKNVKENICQFE